MPIRVPYLMSVAAAAAGAVMPVAAAAQTSPVAAWQAPSRFLPPALAAEVPETAAQCLALAITYEAGLEPVAGQEAVAQVILNRVRHSAYPDTVCGVVWQGSQRRTGCQFTFTCDGSLRSARSPAALAAAQLVAARVLAGETVDHVRGATHYHANYVSPYWAPSLIRVRQIATHIYYRSPGVLGGDGAPIIVSMAAAQPRKVQQSSPASTLSEPSIRDGQYAPWGLTLGTTGP